VNDVKFKIRKGDTVEIISGRKTDKGQHGEETSGANSSPGQNNDPWNY
jgi:hypothetical protein